MKGLIIKPNWADYILDGYKDLEIRGSNTKIRGDIGIIQSGSKMVYGTANLKDTIKLNKQLFDELQNRHLLSIQWEELLKIYKTPYAWYLSNAKRYKTPISYEHKQGCVIWVNL
jgi:predicted transcriptional regulator